MMLVGLIWALLAPLLLVAATAVLGRALKRRGVSHYLLVAAILVLVPIATVYWLDRRAFAAECATRGEAFIAERATTDGIVLTSGTANSFGTRYVSQEGFRFMETLDYMQGYKGWARYEKDKSGAVVSTKIDGPTARYEVREEHVSLPRGVSFSTVSVIDRQTGRVMAKAADGRFLGGRVGWLLGAWGSASCAGRMSEEGVTAFDMFYHLARRTLRS